ncbi:MAG: hypothetical protein ABI427_20320, partial [Solirubrobacteraceae bacterium]
MAIGGAAGLLLALLLVATAARTLAFAQQEASDAPPADSRFARPDIAELTIESGRVAAAAGATISPRDRANR